MNNFFNKNYTSFLSNKIKFFHSILLIGILSLFVLINSIDNLNKDGVMYLIQAHHINNNDLEAAYSIFPKITFAYLIASVQKISGLEYLASAHMLCYFFYIGSVLIFLKSLEIFLIGENNFKYLAGLIITITSFQYLDSYLEMVLRDHGFLFFINAGLYFLLRFFFEKKKLSFVFISFILFFSASFFRNEALIFLLFIIVFLIFYEFNKHIIFFKNIKNLFHFFIFFSFIFLVIYLLWDIIFNVEFFTQRFNSFISNITHPIDLNTDNFWLSELIDGNNHLIKFSILFGVFFWKFLNFLGLFYLTLSIVYFKFYYQNKHLPIIFLFIFSLIPVFLNFNSTFVLSSRYFLCSLIFLNLLLTFCLASIINQRDFFDRHVSKFLYIFLIISALISFSDILVDKKNINYEKNLAMWFLNNNIDTNAIYSIDERVDYYMNRFIHHTERPQLHIAINELKYKYFLIRNDDIFNKHPNFKELIIESPYQHKDIKVFYRDN